MVPERTRGLWPAACAWGLGPFWWACGDVVEAGSGSPGLGSAGGRSRSPVNGRIGIVRRRNPNGASAKTSPQRKPN